MKAALTFILGIFIFWIVILPSVSSLSVVSDFLENNTLVLQEHETKIYGIRLQNGKDYPVYIGITYDDSYANIIDYKEEYEVSPQTSLPIQFNVSSERFQIGQITTIGYTVHEVSGSGEGVPLRLKISKNFKVKVEKAPSDPFYAKMGIVSSIILVFIAYLIIYKKMFKKKKQNKRKKKEFL